MEQILDRFILLLFCIGVLVVMPARTALVVAFLCAVIFASLSEVLQRRSVDYVLCGVWILTEIFVPEFAVFYPLMAYVLFIQKAYIAFAVGIAVTIWCSPISELQSILFTVIGSVLALLLWLRSNTIMDLRKRLGQIQDDSAEYTLLLEEKNRSIIRNQNTELYAATLRERNRIAREIHDNVGHILSRAILMVGALKAVMKENVSMLSELDVTLNTAMTSIRDSVHDLRDESVNLCEALAALADHFTFCKVDLSYDDENDIPSNLKYSVIAIVSEALNNVMKHSNATHVNVVFREHPGIYQLVIEDNGGDLPAKESVGSFHTEERKMGLENMRSRVRSLGGNINFRTDGGFRIFITVPKG